MIIPTTDDVTPDEAAGERLMVEGELLPRGTVGRRPDSLAERARIAAAVRGLSFDGLDEQFCWEEEICAAVLAIVDPQ